MKQYKVIGFSSVTGEIFEWDSKSFNQARRRAFYLVNDMCVDNVRIYDAEGRYCISVIRNRPDRWGDPMWWVHFVLGH